MVPLPLPSHYRFQVTLAHANTSSIVVTVPPINAPHRLPPFITIHNHLSPLKPLFNRFWCFQINVYQSQTSCTAPYCTAPHQYRTIFLQLRLALYNPLLFNHHYKDRHIKRYVYALKRIRRWNSTANTTVTPYVTVVTITVSDSKVTVNVTVKVKIYC